MILCSFGTPAGDVRVALSGGIHPNRRSWVLRRTTWNSNSHLKGDLIKSYRSILSSDFHRFFLDRLLKTASQSVVNHNSELKPSPRLRSKTKKPSKRTAESPQKPCSTGPQDLELVVFTGPSADYLGKWFDVWIPVD